MSEAYDYEAEELPEDEGQAEPAQPWVLTAPQSANLAFDLDDSLLGQIGAKVCEEFEIDVISRQAAGYDEKLKRAVELATLAKTAKAYPWDGASNVKYPLIIQAAIQFNARSYPAVIDGPNVVKASMKGQPTPEKAERAERVANHMSWQLLEEEEEWEEDTDALLLRLSIVGTLFRKRYFDPMLGRNCSHVIGPEEFVVNYRAKRDLSVVPRMTHVLSFYPHEITEKKRAGLWLDVDLGQAQDAANDDQAPHEFLEQYRLWDLDEDGYPEPYIVTTHKETQKVVRIVARWYPEGVKVNQEGQIERIKPYQCFTKYPFIPSPDGSFYDMGFGTLLGAHSDTINTVLNQLMDAATLSNLQSGFIGEGVSIKSGNLRFKPGEWKKAGTSGGALRENIVPLPTKEPSSVLYQLMVFLIDTAKDLTATQEILTGDAGKGTMPVGTVQALVEQGLKTFTAIVKRLHRAFKRELRILYELNGRYLEPEVYFEFQDVSNRVVLEDYAEGDLDIVPVSDPNMATDMQRMSQAQVTLGIAKEAGGDLRAAGMRALEAARVPNPEEIFPPPQGPPPPDPKLVEVEAKAKAKDRELDIKEVATAADVASKNADTERKKLETMMMGPEVASMIEQIVADTIQRTLAMVNNGGQAPVQPQQLPGMGEPPPDAGLSGPPEGSAGPPGGPMGPGPGDGPPLAGEGAPPGGAFDPQLG